MKHFSASDLILNNDGSVFHLKLIPGQIARNIILVGDPDRVNVVSSFFSKIDLKVKNREFITHTGEYKGKKLTVISTGIGTDNIDIVLNELDALVNINLDKRITKDSKIPLNIVRIGTSGALQDYIKLGSFLLTTKAIGFDGLLNYYSGIEDFTEKNFEKALIESLPWNERLATPYVVTASSKLLDKLSGPKTVNGVTVSAPGFYGPQGRSLRLLPSMTNLNRSIEEFCYQNQRITNFEMESSAIYGLARLLGHNAATLCAIIANRVTEEYLTDYKPVIAELIKYTLDRITEKKHNHHQKRWISNSN